MQVKFPTRRGTRISLQFLQQRDLSQGSFEIFDIIYGDRY